MVDRRRVWSPERTLREGKRETRGERIAACIAVRGDKGNCGAVRGSNSTMVKSVSE